MAKVKFRTLPHPMEQKWSYQSTLVHNITFPQLSSYWSCTSSSNADHESSSIFFHDETNSIIVSSCSASYYKRVVEDGFPRANPKKFNQKSLPEEENFDPCSGNVCTLLTRICKPDKACKDHGENLRTKT